MGHVDDASPATVPGAAVVGLPVSSSSASEAGTKLKIVARAAGPCVAIHVHNEIASSSVD